MAKTESTRRAHNFKDLTGQTFGLLTALSLSKTRKGYGAYWLCRCECGNEKVILGKCLNRGTTKTCGCRPTGLRHGHARRSSQTSVHRCWVNMIQRCTNPKWPKWEHYGGRGISVCEHWLAFENFYADMGDPPSAKHSIDRRDNNGNYEPGNCRWATKREQCSNQRRNHNVTFGGRTQAVIQWAREFGVNPDTLRHRLKKGWDIGLALSTPPLPHNQRRTARGRGNSD